MIMSRLVPALADRALLIDMDGVLYRGETPVPGAREFVGYLQSQRIPHLFLTNNSDHTKPELTDRLARMNINVPADAMFSAADATAGFLSRGGKTGTAYVIGGPGVRTALTEYNWRVIESQTMPSETIDAVVVGEGVVLTAQSMAVASRLVASGVPFYATNPDTRIPVGDSFIPGCKALYAGIEVATGKSPLVSGKPSPIMFGEGLKRIGATADASVMIGDRLDTDVRGGIEMGMLTVLVLSGASRFDDIARSPYQPDIVVETIGQLVEN
ncbi:MAG: HAD-IIA family hydrolase [Planctomycetota bacterium]